MRQVQLAEVSEMLVDETVDGTIFAADCNLGTKEELPRGAKLGDDAWILAGGPEDSMWTWPAFVGDPRPKQRFDRIFLKGKKAGRRSASSLTLRHGSFRLLHGEVSDHFGVACTATLREAREKQLRRRQRCSGEPLRVGARARVGKIGVARRPGKGEACAKVEPGTEKNPGGALYYCGKHHEKPRIPVGDAAILEDPRRKGLWRLHMPRNCPYVNSHLVGVAIALGANSDCQAILTAKGVADYVCKYITKYDAGASINARVSSLLDDIISRVPEGRSMSVASPMCKAFIATAVPAT